MDGRKRWAAKEKLQILKECDELENVEALAFGMGKQRVVKGTFALVEQSPGTGRPVNA